MGGKNRSVTRREREGGGRAQGAHMELSEHTKDVHHGDDSTNKLERAVTTPNGSTTATMTGTPSPHTNGDTTGAARALPEETKMEVEDTGVAALSSKPTSEDHLATPINVKAGPASQLSDRFFDIVEARTFASSLEAVPAQNAQKEYQQQQELEEEEEEPADDGFAPPRCFVCAFVFNEGVDPIFVCRRCGKMYHVRCTGGTERTPYPSWVCPRHSCVTCAAASDGERPKSATATTITAAIKWVCTHCPRSYCDHHLPSPPADAIEVDSAVSRGEARKVSAVAIPMKCCHCSDRAQSEAALEQEHQARKSRER